MSAYDNEIYRGPPETGPTLAQDTPSYGTDFYIVKPPQATVQQDAPPTEEAVRQESRPAAKKKSSISKAMKLLASCAATVAVVTTLAAPVEPVPELPEWPQILPSTYGYTYDLISQNSVDCQVANSHNSYLLTAQQEGVYLTWDRGFYTYFEVNMAVPAEDWVVYLYFDTDPTSIEDRKTEYLGMYSEEDQPAFGSGQIQTVSGETLYVLGMMWRNEMEEELPPVQQIIDHLDAYIQISDATADYWDKLLIGDTMYTKINPRWSGTIGSSDSNEYLWYELCAVRPLADTDCSADNLICQRRINGIDWSFYYGDLGYYLQFSNRVIWAVPAQEEIALGYNSIIGGIYLGLLEGFYVDDVVAWAKKVRGDTDYESAVDFIIYNDPYWEVEGYGCEPSATWPEILEAVVDNTIVKYIVSQIYPVEQMPEHKPVDIPPDATEVPSTEATVDVPESTTEAPIKVTEALPRVETVVLYEYTDPDEKRTRTTYYDQNDEVIKTEDHIYKNGALSGYASKTYQGGYTVKEEEYTYEENGNVTYKYLNDKQKGVHSSEQFEYDENGVLRGYSLTYYASSSNTAPEVEIYYEDYDESGTLTYTRHAIYDPETGLWTVKDLGDTWRGGTYADGIFTVAWPYANSQLVEGVFYATSLETGNLWNYTEKNEDGSYKCVWNYSDGSLEQSAETTIDSETNTWIYMSEYHPTPSDDFAHHTETRVRFYDDGSIAEYYHNSDGDIIEATFDENDQSVKYEEYDKNGKLVECHLSQDNRYISIIRFHYDQWGRLESVSSNTTYYG